MQIDRKYIVDENNRKVAVQLDMEIFEKIEEILENYGLVQFMLSDGYEETLDIHQARNYYKSLETVSYTHLDVYKRQTQFYLNSSKKQKEIII